MMLWRTSKRPRYRTGLALSLVALLFGAVGSHVIHPHIHSHGACKRCEASCHPEPETDRAGRLVNAAKCPVCQFLKGFNAEVSPPSMLDGVMYADVLQQPTVHSAHRCGARSPFSSRAPPSHTLRS